MKTPEWRKAGVCLAHGNHQNPKLAQECPLNRPRRASKAPRLAKKALDAQTVAVETQAPGPAAPRTKNA